MLAFRRFASTMIPSLIIVSVSSFAAAQDATVRKDIEALYAKRDKAIKDKDVVAFRSTMTKDFRGLTGENAALSESIFKQGKDVKSFVTHIESIKPCPESVPEQVDANCEENDIIVTVREYGKMTFDILSDGALDKGTWFSGLQHVLLRTDDGWRIKYEGGSGGGFVAEKEGEARGEEVTDNQVWQDLKALYAKWDKALGARDLTVIKSLQTDDYAEAKTEIEKLKGKNRLTTTILAISQGIDKNEVLVDVNRGWVGDGGMGAESTVDIWRRPQNGWKLKGRR